MKKIELEIIALSDSTASNNTFAIVLGEKVGNRRLPVIIGAFEAQAIAVEMEKMRPARPLTHDLFRNFAQSFDIRIEEVVIVELKEGIFYARLHCRSGAEVREVDARTSDAIALAIRFNCPIYTYEHIMAEGGLVFEEDGNATPASKANEEVEAPRTGRKGPFALKSDEELEKLLNEALGNEDYERAAKIRDEIDRRRAG